MKNIIHETEVITEHTPNYHNITEQQEQEPSDIVGCLRGIIGCSVGSILTVGGGIGIGIQYGIGLGILTGIVLFVVFICFAIYLMNNAKQLTILDCFLPIVAGGLSAILFAPISLAGMNVFSSRTCLPASLFLTIMLLMFHAKKNKQRMADIAFSGIYV